MKAQRTVENYEKKMKTVTQQQAKPRNLISIIHLFHIVHCVDERLFNEDSTKSPMVCEQM